MSTNFQQPTSPEMRPEIAARFMTVKYARYGLQKSLLTMPKFAQFLAGAKVVNEEMKVPEVIDYTIHNQDSIDLESVSSDVSLEGFEQHKRLLQAEQALKVALDTEDYRNQYGLSA